MRRSGGRCELIPGFRARSREGVHLQLHGRSPPRRSLPNLVCSCSAGSICTLDFFVPVLTRICVYIDGKSRLFDLTLLERHTSSQVVSKSVKSSRGPSQLDSSSEFLETNSTFFDLTFFDL